MPPDGARPKDRPSKEDAVTNSKTWRQAMTELLEPMMVLGNAIRLLARKILC